MKILILDDMDVRHQGFKKLLVGHELTHCYTYEEAIAALEQEVFDAVFLDHDLTDEQTCGIDDGEKCGYDFAVEVAKLPEDRKPKTALLHSWNPTGVKRMRMALAMTGIAIIVYPYSDTMPIRIS